MNNGRLILKKLRSMMYVLRKNIFLQATRKWPGEFRMSLDV